jgi:hypothetical protein
VRRRAARICAAGHRPQLRASFPPLVVNAGDDGSRSPADSANLRAAWALDSTAL